MSLVARRLRSLLIALAVLALSGTAALAGHSALSTPPAAAAQSQDGDEQADENETPEVDEADDSDSDEAPGADDPADSGTAAEHPDNHGKLVSEAAQGPTPADAANHGAYVRTIAQANQGHADAATKHAKNNTSH